MELTHIHTTTHHLYTASPHHHHHHQQAAELRRRRSCSWASEEGPKHLAGLLQPSECQDFTQILLQQPYICRDFQSTICQAETRKSHVFAHKSGLKNVCGQHFMAGRMCKILQPMGFTHLFFTLYSIGRGVNVIMTIVYYLLCFNLNEMFSSSSYFALCKVLFISRCSH